MGGPAPEQFVEVFQACFWPVMNRAIWSRSTLAMMPVVKIPVRLTSWAAIS
jgi:hypothetical protein